MILNISIEYRTTWGEQIVLCLAGKRYPLEYVADGMWKGEITRFNPAKAAEYSYEVVRDGVTIRTEWKKHTLVLPEGVEPKVLNVYDRWIDRPGDAPFYSSAFTSAIFSRKAAKAQKTPKGANVSIQVTAPALRPNEVLAIAGSGKALKDCTASEIQCAAFVRSHKTPKGVKVSEQDMMSVSDLEKITGFTYFPNVPQAPKGSYRAADWGL